MTQIKFSTAQSNGMLEKIFNIAFLTPVFWRKVEAIT